MLFLMIAVLMLITACGETQKPGSTANSYTGSTTEQQAAPEGSANSDAEQAEENNEQNNASLRKRQIRFRSSWTSSRWMKRLDR